MSVVKRHDGSLTLPSVKTDPDNPGTSNIIICKHNFWSTENSLSSRAQHGGHTHREDGVERASTRGLGNITYSNLLPPRSDPPRIQSGPTEIQIPAHSTHNTLISRKSDSYTGKRIATHKWLPFTHPTTRTPRIQQAHHSDCRAIQRYMDQTSSL